MPNNLCLKGLICCKLYACSTQRQQVQNKNEQFFECQDFILHGRAKTRRTVNFIFFFVLGGTQDKKQQEVGIQVQKIFSVYQILLMQGPQNLLFTPDPNLPYKIISVMDYQKAFTLRDNDHKLTINDYHGAPNQLFNIYQNNQKYAFVNPATSSALHVEQENKGDGGVVKSDPGQFESSFFHIAPVAKGEWAGKACHINTFSDGKSLDIKGGKANPNTEICQWKFHGNNNQAWLVIPADNIQPQGGKAEGHAEEKADEIPDVPAQFQPKPKTAYKVVSVINDDKCLTVTKDNKLELNQFKKDKHQKFQIHLNEGKLALVCAAGDSGLCIFEDKQDNGVQIIADKGKHNSSWFTLARAEKGKWCNKAYLIKTHTGNKALDICGGKAEDGKKILQYNIHQGQNQLWLIEPFAEDKKKPKKDNKKNNKKGGKEKVIPDVQPQFHTDPEHSHRIHSVLDKTLVLTVTKQNKLIVSKNKNRVDQQFKIVPENNKFGIVGKKAKAGLCIFQDNADTTAQIIVDAGKHTSSWFDIVRAEKGPYAHKGYLIRTHAGKVLDINGGYAQEGKNVFQFDVNEAGSQIWVIDTMNKKAPPKKKEPFKNWETQISQVYAITPQANKGNNNGMGFIQNAQFKPEQNYIFYPVHGGGTKCLDIAQDKMNHSSLIMYSFHGAPNQRFVFEQEGAMVRIRNVQEKKYLNVTNDDPSQGMWIRCDNKGTAQSELWTIIPATEPKYAGKGAFHIRSIFGLALTAPNSTLDNSAHICQESFHCEDGQTWIIKEI